jgi:hypothetical protein
MGQYTDKINRISEDFQRIEDYERVNCILAQNGCLVIIYEHGGYRVTTQDRPGEYNMHELEPNSELIVPSFDEDYLELKRKYGSEQRPYFTRVYDKWQQIKARLKRSR